jgi:protein TonB
MVLRYAGSLTLATLVTLALFFQMRALVWRGDGGMEPQRQRLPVDFVRTRRDSEVETKQRQRPERIEPKVQPRPPTLDVSKTAPPQQRIASIPAPAFRPSLSLAGGPTLGSASTDADVVPIIRINPQYPVRAQARGVEGWVHLRFTVTRQGTTTDIEVIDADPKGYFERSAKNAVRKYKYKPRIEGGAAVDRPGVELVLEFDLED